MLTKIIVKNFKRFGDVEIELGNPVVLIGPNNSGKTSALQALALWEAGLKRWNEKRKEKKTPERRPGVTINRRDLVSVPVPNARLLWHGLHIRKVKQINGKPDTKNAFIDIIVEGVSQDKLWRCGLEFYYANEESFYCRPLRLSEDKKPERMLIPEEADNIQIAFLPPMSGLATNEIRLDPGTINMRVGEGRTAEVLRNLCYRIYNEDKKGWEQLKGQIESLFGSKLNDPEYIPERGEIEMSYVENRVKLDLSSSGRGLQQTLLLLSYMYANPNAVLLLDEPDAHLEFLRQRQTYRLLSEVARENNSQIIAASHSEIILNEAADRDVVIAFVGKPHRINDRGSQVRKSLKVIGWEHYYQAAQTGWGLYLEGSTDLAILQALAKKLNYEKAQRILERPYVHYTGNLPNEALKYFHGIREAIPNFKGIALYDRIEEELPSDPNLKFLMWKRREIENYLCYPETLFEYVRSIAESKTPGPLFRDVDVPHWVEVMKLTIKELEDALHDLDKGSPWDHNLKVSDEFLVPLFKRYFHKLSLPNIMAKKNFHELAYWVPREKLDPEIKEKLDEIVKVAVSVRIEDHDV